MKKIATTALILFSIHLTAQKRPVSISDFNNWNSIASTKLSDNGKRLVYELKPGKGDTKLIFYDIETGKQDTFMRASGTSFNGDATLAAFKISPSLNQKRQAKKDKLTGDKEPKDTLAILVFEQDTLFKFPKLKSFAIPENGGRWVAFTSEDKFLPKKDTSLHDSIKVKPPKLPKGGNVMLIFNGETGDTSMVRNVTAFTWSKNGKTLAYATQKKDSVTQSTVAVFNTQTLQYSSLFSIEGEIKKLAVDEAGEQLAWLSSADTVKIKTFDLRYCNLSRGTVQLLADTLSEQLPVGWAPSENGSVSFSKSGKRLFFGSAKRPEQEKQDTLLSGEKVSVDVWSWQDKELQPQQKLNLNRDKKRTYQTMYDIKKKKLVQLCNEKYENIRLDVKHDKTYGISTNNDHYSRSSSWDGRYLNDYYLVELETGKKELMVSGKAQAFLSPGETYFVYYELTDSNYYGIHLKTRRETCLNKNIPEQMVNEEHDTPSDPYPYGNGGWSKQDEWFYLYDRYDIWRVDPKGKEMPVNLTHGRDKKTNYRFITLDPEQEYIDRDQLQLLRIFNEKTKESGWANLNLKSTAEPETLVFGSKYYSYPRKSEKADMMYYTRQDCREYPDLWLCNRDLTLNKKITGANPQQASFIWNCAELVKWTSFNGDSLEGLLYKPENFDPKKSYPVMVYFYERNADNLYRFNAIYPSYSTINKSLYVSNGYVVFVPDIKYRIGYPGQSAYECIVSGVQNLIDKYPWIDAKHMGLQGQSWGGYQTAYLITQTNMFAAAMAGAPVSNMTSAYGGIRWGSGMSRMFQYEHTQSRIGGTLWDKPLLYIENSPLFYANKVNTPLLIMHNDNDGAVPWYQGIEYFVALRRLDKPVWMLTYNNEPHNLNPSSWGNRTDLSIRMKAFFDHYLMNKDAPDWMINGVKAVDKEYMKGF